MRSVNIFRNPFHAEFPLRLEFWNNDVLESIYEVKEISNELAEIIRRFITY